MAAPTRGNDDFHIFVFIRCYYLRQQDVASVALAVYSTMNTKFLRGYNPPDELAFMYGMSFCTPKKIFTKRTTKAGYTWRQKNHKYDKEESDNYSCTKKVVDICEDYGLKFMVLVHIYTCQKLACFRYFK